MYQNVEIINSVEHKNKAVKEIKSLASTKEMISAPISFTEFYEACRDFPIFFAKDAQGEWFATALLGYNNKNMFVDDNGKWKTGAYIPAFIRRYPFILVKTDGEDEKNPNYTLAVDKECLEDATESNKERALYDNDEPSKLSKGAMDFLIELNSTAEATKGFIKDLEDWGVLVAQTASMVDKEGNTHNLNGFFTINEEKMAHLGEKKKIDMCNKGALPLITAHLISLGNIRRIGL